MRSSLGTSCMHHSTPYSQQSTPALRPIVVAHMCSPLRCGGSARTPRAPAPSATKTRAAGSAAAAAGVLLDWDLHTARSLSPQTRALLYGWEPQQPASLPLLPLACLPWSCWLKLRWRNLAVVLAAFEGCVWAPPRPRCVQPGLARWQLGWPGSNESPV